MSDCVFAAVDADRVRIAEHERQRERRQLAGREADEPRRRIGDAGKIDVAAFARELDAKPIDPAARTQWTARGQVEPVGAGEQTERVAAGVDEDADLASAELGLLARLSDERLEPLRLAPNLTIGAAADRQRDDQRKHADDRDDDENLDQAEAARCAPASRERRPAMDAHGCCGHAPLRCR